MHLRVSTFSGLCGGAWFCLLVIKKNRSPKTQPDTLTQKASTSLSLRKPAFAFDSYSAQNPTHYGESPRNGPSPLSIRKKHSTHASPAVEKSPAAREFCGDRWFCRLLPKQKSVAEGTARHPDQKGFDFAQPAQTRFCF
jgi:hypothetical protein